MSTASEMVELYLAAEAKILKGQAVRMGERSLTMANLTEVVNERKQWERRLASENNRGRGYSLASFYE